MGTFLKGDAFYIYVILEGALFGGVSRGWTLFTGNMACMYCLY